MLVPKLQVRMLFNIPSSGLIRLRGTWITG